jgi:DNA helicase-2/ATP-dependent DNA helicase PcrA
MWIGTFHSLACRILRRDIERLGFTRDFIIYDDQDSKSLIKKLLKDLNYPESIFTVEKCKYKIEGYKNRGLLPADISPQMGNLFEIKMKAFYETYENALKTNNSVDFGNLLLHVYRLLTKDNEFRHKIAAQFKVILVDEFQDTNEIQYGILKILARNHQNLTVVGDDDQSIYSWRGATVLNILNFSKDYPQAQTIKLEQNYRSTGHIIRAANAVVDGNSHRLEKKLWTANEAGEKITLMRAEDESHEAALVIQHLKQLIRQGLRLGTAAVFYRTNAQSRIFEEELVREQIPYQLVGGFRFYERREIKDLLAYLKFVANPFDSISFKRMINTPTRGIGDKTLSKIEDERHQAKSDYLTAVTNMLGRGEFSKTLRQKISHLCSLVQKTQQGILNGRIAESVAALIAEIAYRDYVGSFEEIDSESRAENVDEFVNSVYSYFAKNPDHGLTQFLDRVSLISDADQIINVEDKVTLMTIHCAKGLEYDHVFMVGMEEGLFPHSRSMESEVQFEEERRLCYVGMTRAKKRLYLLCARERRIFGTIKYSQPSIFLAEIPGELVQTSLVSEQNFSEQWGRVKASPYSLQ